MVDRKFMKAAEVADLLGLSLNRVYQFTREGILPAVYLGRLIRYDPLEIEKFCKNGGRKHEAT